MQLLPVARRRFHRYQTNQPYFATMGSSVVKTGPPFSPRIDLSELIAFECTPSPPTPPSKRPCTSQQSLCDLSNSVFSDNCPTVSEIPCPKKSTFYVKKLKQFAPSPPVAPSKAKGQSLPTIRQVIPINVKKEIESPNLVSVKDEKEDFVSPLIFPSRVKSIKVKEEIESPTKPILIKLESRISTKGSAEPDAPSKQEEISNGNIP